jgi:hypothetical protein
LRVKAVPTEFDEKGVANGVEILNEDQIRRKPGRFRKHLPASRYRGQLDSGRLIGVFSHFHFVAFELGSQQVL